MGLFRDRKLGVATKRQYDLPLDKSEGTSFIILLIGLMTFLGFMAIAASFVLSAMTERWSSGLENKATIEIPAQTKQGKIRTDAQIKTLMNKVSKVMRANPSVKSIEILEKQDIQDLLEPWLGEGSDLGDIPLPGLVSIELMSSSQPVIKSIERDLKSVANNIRLDTHRDWLTDLLSFTGSLQFSAVLITLVIGVTTATSIAGAVSSRVAIHKKDVELLHLMGASDEYIAKQFQRHALLLTLRGAIVGGIIGGAVLFTIPIFSADMATTLVPDFSLNFIHLLIFMTVPFIISGISLLAARMTVLRALAKMP